MVLTFTKFEVSNFIRDAFFSFFFMWNARWHVEGGGKDVCGTTKWAGARKRAFCA